MAISEGCVELLKELLRGFAPFTVRRMFGGAGLFVDGIMFAIVIDDALYLKADAGTSRAFEEEGLAPFSYQRGGRSVQLSYWRAPDRLLDDGEELREWAHRSLNVARKTTAARPRRPAGKKRRKAS